MKKFWYNIRQKGGRWAAYQITAEQAGNIKRGFEITGPHKNIVACMIAANKTKGKSYEDRNDTKRHGS